MLQPQPASLARLPASRGSRAARLALGVATAVLLLTGGLNLRTLVGGKPTWWVDPSAPVSLDGLVEPEARPAALDAQILALQDALRDGDATNDVRAAVTLGQAYLQKVRETGDTGYYPKAEALFREALAADDRNVDALIGFGTLDLARHRFAEALAWGERARELDPARARAYGVVGDALIELGRYDEAVRTLQAMVDLRPDLASYARVSYARELMGDRPGAIAAMEQAATAGAGYPENVAWVRVQLGNLRFDGGDIAGAARDYAAALTALPDYAPAAAGQAKVAAARGDLPRAADLYDVVVRRLPLPEFVVAYGEVLTAMGRPREARAQFDLAEAIQQLNAANGVDTDLELALFAADYGKPEDLPTALERARTTVAKRPSVFAYDALAWVQYRSGNLAAARDASRQALRLGTRNALLFFHAGTIAAALGERAEATEFLERALALNPHFSVRFAPEARATLDRLRAEEASR